MAYAAERLALCPATKFSSASSARSSALMMRLRAEVEVVEPLEEQRRPLRGGRLGRTREASDGEVHARSLPVSQQRVGRLPDPVVLELVLDAQLLQLVVVVDVTILDQPVGAARWEEGCAPGWPRGARRRWCRPACRRPGSGSTDRSGCPGTPPAAGTRSPSVTGA